jgi:hypothetical protein
MAAIVPRPFSGNFTRSETHAVKKLGSFIILFKFFCERGGHVISAAILDFRIFPEKSEEKKDIKIFVSVKIIFSTEIHGQTSK